MSKGSMGIGRLGGSGLHIKRKWRWTFEGKDITGEVTLPEMRVKISARPVVDLSGIATHEMTLIANGRSSYHDLSTDIAIIRLYDGCDVILETWVLEDIKKFFRREGCQFDYYDEPALEYTLEYGRAHYTSHIPPITKQNAESHWYRPLADGWPNQQAVEESMAQYKNKYVGSVPVQPKEGKYEQMMGGDSY